MVSQTRIWVIVVIVVIGGIGIWCLDFTYGTFGKTITGSGNYVVNACYPLSFQKNPDGTYAVPTDLLCKNGLWINTSRKSGFDLYCDAYYRLINISYTASEPVTTVIEAKGEEFCQNNTIVKSLPNCGNGICESNEIEENCWFDCGPIQSWQKMFDAVAARPDLTPYLANQGTFRYDLPAVESLAKEVEATNPRTPFEAIRTLTRLIAQKISYVPGGVGGNQQCGEDSQAILTRGTGNCVDYSAVMIATLRRGFDISDVGRVKIPTRQVAGCLSGFQTWKAVEYNPAASSNLFLGAIIGHSWTEAWVGGNRWTMCDPTTDTALAKTWFGYHKVATSATDQLCYIANIEDKNFCEVYGTTAAT